MLVADPELPDGERVKVLDFGIAKMAENLGGRPNATDSNMVMGTPLYMSPEQCKGAKLVTDRADVYSLGIMMYQMLAGRPPFIAEAAGELLIMQVTEPVPPLDGFVPGTEPSLVHLIHSMLAKESTTRPSMDAVMAALQQIEKRALAAQSADQDATQRLSPVQLRSSIVPTPKQASGDRALAVHSSLNGSSAEADPPPLKFHNSTVTDAASEATSGKRRTRKRSVALVSVLGVALAGSLLIYRATRPPTKTIAVSQETVNPPGPVTVETVVKTQELGPSPPTPPTSPAESKKASTPKNDSSNGKQDQSPPPKPPIVPIPKSDPHLLEARKFFEARKYIEAMYEAQLCGPGKETRFQCNLIRGRAACRLDNRTDAQAVINEFNQSQRLDKDKAIKKIERECSLKSLGFAEELLRKQEFQQAKKLARTNESADPERAWKIIGRAACILRDGPSVLEALVKLSPYPASNAEVREECRLNHVDIHNRP